MGDLKLIYDEKTIRNRVKELARRILRDYADEKPIVCICVLRGAFMFFSDIVKELKSENIILDFIRLSSYGSETSSSGKVKMITGLTEAVEGKHVLIIEDIVDTGYTLQYLHSYFKDKKASDVKVACLLDKPMTRMVSVKADYIAFTLDKPAFIVGYGLDCDQLYRNLNGLYLLEE